MTAGTIDSTIVAASAAAGAGSTGAAAGAGSTGAAAGAGSTGAAAGATLIGGTILAQDRRFYVPSTGSKIVQYSRDTGQCLLYKLVFLPVNSSLYEEVKMLRYM